MQPYGPNPYAPPQQSTFGPPPNDGSAATKTWRWYVVFTAGMAILYLACAGLFAVLTAFVEDGDELSAGECMFLAAVCAGLALPFGAAPFLPKKPWAWTYHLVLIGLCLTSCAFWPVCIPLVIRWTKPETKALFGKA